MGKKKARVQNLGSYDVNVTLSKNKIWIDKNSCNYALLDAAAGTTTSKPLRTDFKSEVVYNSLQESFQNLLRFPLEAKKKKVVVTENNLPDIYDDFIVAKETPVTMMK